MSTIATLVLGHRLPQSARLACDQRIPPLLRARDEARDRMRTERVDEQVAVLVQRVLGRDDLPRRRCRLPPSEGPPQLGPVQ